MTLSAGLTYSLVREKHRFSYEVSHMTDKIHLRQGVPQGDIISPYICILMVETLLLKISFTTKLTGITFAKQESRSETFADDTTIILQKTKNNLIFAKKYLTDFHSISGLSCNVEKTNVIPIGVNTCATTWVSNGRTISHSWVSLWRTP